MKGLVVACAVASLVPSLYAQRPACDYRGPEPSLFMDGRDAQGYFVRLSDSEDTRAQIAHRPDFRASVAKGLLPPGQNYWPQADDLARAAGVMAFCVGPASGRHGDWPAQNAAPLPLDGIWRGADPLSCLRSFAQAAGLEVIVPQPGLWLVGPEVLVRQAALLVVAYSMDPTPQLVRNESAVRDLELAFLARLPIHQFLPPFQRHDKTWDLSPALITLGYYTVPGEPDTYLVQVTQGTFTNPSAGPEQLTTLAAKLHVRREAGKLTVDCLWTKSPNGPLVAGVQEDLDGDGFQDFYFQEAADSDQPDLIVSGADGSLTASVTGETLAVEKNIAGPKRFSVKSLWAQPGKARVYRFNAGTKELEVVEPRGASASAVSDVQSGPVRSFDWPAQAMAAELGSLDRMRVYCLPGFLAPHTPGMDLVRLHSSPVWGWFLNRNPREAIEQIPANLAMHVVYKYLSPGYLKERETEKISERK